MTAGTIHEPPRKSRPPRKGRCGPKRSPLGREIGACLDGRRDVREVLGSVIGEDRARVLSDAVRRVRLRSVGDSARFEPTKIHPVNTPQERRCAALLLIVLSHVSSRGRAWTSELYRGRRTRIDEHGEVKHCPSVSAGGLAARLGCSVREIERYLLVLFAAGLLDVWQGPKDSPERYRGSSGYAYAVYQWIGEVPREVARRLRSWWGEAVEAAKAAAALLAAPPTRAAKGRDQEIAAQVALFAGFVPPS